VHVVDDDTTGARAASANHGAAISAKQRSSGHARRIVAIAGGDDATTRSARRTHLDPAHRGRRTPWAPDGAARVARPCSDERRAALGTSSALERVGRDGGELDR